jgi:hypothetical protein
LRQSSSYPTSTSSWFDSPNPLSPVRPRPIGLTKPKHKAYSMHWREINVPRIDAGFCTVTSARFSSPSASVNCSPSEGLLYSIKTGCSPNPDVKEIQVQRNEIFVNNIHITHIQPRACGPRPSRTIPERRTRLD